MTQSFKAEEEARLHTAAGRLERRIATLKRDFGAEMALDAKVVKYQQQHPDVAYSEALSIVMQDPANKNLAAQYVASFGAHKVGKAQVEKFAIEPDYKNEDASSVAAGKEIDALVLAWLREHPQAKYSDGLDVILAGHPDLRMQWLKKYEGHDMRTGKPYVAPQAMDDDDDGEKGSASAGKEIDRLVKHWLKTNGRPDSDYERGLGHILQTHPELAKKWTKR